jgi:hypothetical protein
MNLQRFVEGGGTLVTLTNSSHPPHPLRAGPRGLHADHSDLWAPGGVFRVSRSDDGSPLAWGYDAELGVYFNQNQSPISPTAAPGPGPVPPQPDGSTTDRRSGRGGIDERDVVQAQGRDWGQESVQAYRAHGGRGGVRRPAGGRRLRRRRPGSADVRTVFRYAPSPRSS